MSLTLLHEHNDKNQHRIVTICDDGTNKAGEWFPVAEVATFLDLYACADPNLGLPAGIFKVREVKYQVLA